MDLRLLLSRLPIRALKEPPPVVSVIRLSGVIGSVGPFRQGMTARSVESVIARAFAPERLSAVALVINSPGGSPVQSDLIAKRLRAAAEEWGKRAAKKGLKPNDEPLPVLAFLEDVAASGGYWLATAADEIFANAGSIVGSIGVVSAGFGFPQALDKLGVERRVYTSGARKGMLDPFQPENQDDIAHLKSLQAELHELFKQQVRDRRGERLASDEEDLFSGAFWGGLKAKELGLVDEIGDLRATLRERFGEKVQIRTVAPRRGSLFRRFSAEHLGEGLATGTLSSLEERALWGRYGL